MAAQCHVSSIGDRLRSIHRSSPACARAIAAGTTDPHPTPMFHVKQRASGRPRPAQPSTDHLPPTWRHSVVRTLLREPQRKAAMPTGGVESARPDATNVDRILTGTSSRVRSRHLPRSYRDVPRETRRTRGADPDAPTTGVTGELHPRRRSDNSDPAQRGVTEAWRGLGHTRSIRTLHAAFAAADATRASAHGDPSRRRRPTTRRHRTACRRRRAVLIRHP